MPPSATPAGREIDFSFRNESGGTVYLAAHVIGSGRKNLQCEVRLYGPSLNGTTYELVTETVEVIPKPEEAIMKEDEDATYVTYVDETKTIKGREGYKVDAYLITYVDGVANRPRKGQQRHLSRQGGYRIRRCDPTGGNVKTTLGCIRRADEDFHMIQPGDRIGVGVSGGGRTACCSCARWRCTATCAITTLP